jgi:hypothetical protein
LGTENSADDGGYSPRAEARWIPTDDYRGDPVEKILFVSRAPCSMDYKNSKGTILEYVGSVSKYDEPNVKILTPPCAYR